MGHFRQLPRIGVPQNGRVESPLICPLDPFRTKLPQTNIAMENGPFEDVLFPSISYFITWGYSIAMLVYQRVDDVGFWMISDFAPKKCQGYYKCCPAALRLILGIRGVEEQQRPPWIFWGKMVV